MTIYNIASEYAENGGELGTFAPYGTVSDRAKWESIPEDYRQALIEDGERYLGYEYPTLPATLYMEFVRNGNRSRYQERYYGRRYALNALVMAECVEGKGRFVDDIANGVYAICEESGWQLPAHNHYINQPSQCLPDIYEPILDLFAAETGEQLAMVIYLVGEELDRVSPYLRKRVYGEIRKRIVVPHLSDRAFWMGGWNDGDVNNWNPWITQNVLLAVFSGLPLEENKRRLVFFQATRSLDYFLDAYGEDGCCNEGPSYYRAAALCLFNAIEVLNAITDNAFASLYQMPKIANMAAYLMHMNVTGGYYANFGDAPHIMAPGGAREYLFAKRVGNQAMMAYAACDHKREQKLPKGENLYYRLQQAFTEDELRKAGDTLAVRLPGDVWYPSAGLVVARDQRLFLAAKMGDNGDSHNHNDTGSITVFKDGEPFLIDVGVETYTKFTFNEARYTIWTMQSLWHNVVNFGDVQQLPGKAYAARVQEVEMDESHALVCAELKGAYPAGAIGSYVRSVELKKGIGIRVEDRLSDLPEGTAMTLMTQAEPVWEGADKGGVLRVGSLGEVCIQTDGRMEIEKVDITDPKLRGEWGDTLYRARFFPRENVLTWLIPE